ncbi:PhzF family phenazine biosynthesis protein, partial [Enterococcus faecium]|uniref:PhzF family phenazine biosynthesis protein n=1 Tax=Enterococcus faecium TaxID=1352 RepID=UPI0037C1679F
MNEDPVCGSAHSNLIPYWAERMNKTKLSAYQMSSRGGDLECERRAKRWLIVHDIPFIEQNLIRQPLTKNEFIHLLKLTNNGVTE